jgi:nucleoside-diphosphate-sugar epimerase
MRYIENQKGDVKDTLADMTKAKGLLKWKPKTKIEEGLKRQIKWMKSENR